jgi:hypothetical protein
VWSGNLLRKSYGIVITEEIFVDENRIVVEHYWRIYNEYLDAFSELLMGFSLIFKINLLEWFQPQIGY